MAGREINSGSGAGLSERSLHLLTALVDRYIREGQPVGSKALSEVLPLSSASIRNVMAELEDRGYLQSPHTSAGRVPTDRAYRLFVDTRIMADQPLEKLLTQEVKQQFDTNLSPAKIAESVSGILSDLTRQAGLVMLPRSQQHWFRLIDFLPLAENRVLVVLVLNEEEVQNRVIHTDRAYSEKELQQAARYINEHFAGRTVDSVRQSLVDSMREDKSAIDQLMELAIDLAGQALDEVAPKESDYVVAGQANLMDEQSSNMERLRELFEAFQQKKDILHLMERCSSGQGVQIFIGEESGYDVLGDFSVITAPYESQGVPVGVLGVIGPRRMAYDKVVPMVDITARLLGVALKSS